MTMTHSVMVMVITVTCVDQKWLSLTTS